MYGTKWNKMAKKQLLASAVRSVWLRQILLSVWDDGGGGGVDVGGGWGGQQGFGVGNMRQTFIGQINLLCNE